MATSHALGLNEAVLGKLRELRRLCVDSSKGFEQCAELTDRVGMQAVFLALADDRREMDAELELEIVVADGAEEEEGSYFAAWHRAWIQLHKSMTTKDEFAILSDAEMGEDVIKSAYEGALSETAGSSIHPLLLAQYARVSKAHDRIRDLRNAAKPQG
ncbi:MAG: PA2169 family four-helix-bundle protein [Lacipirellulaceae bacterium]